MRYLLWRGAAVHRSPPLTTLAMACADASRNSISVPGPALKKPLLVLRMRLLRASAWCTMLTSHSISRPLLDVYCMWNGKLLLKLCWYTVRPTRWWATSSTAVPSAPPA